MKIAEIFESFYDDDGFTFYYSKAEMKQAINDGLWQEFIARFPSILQDKIPNIIWDAEKLRPDLKTDEIYLPKKQYSALESYASQISDEKFTITNEMKQRFTKFINTYGTTYDEWVESDEGQQIKKEVENDLARFKAPAKKKYYY